MFPALDPIVITGLGVLACNGIGRQQFWDALEAGRSGIRQITRFDPSHFPCQIAGQIWDFDPNDFLTKADVRRWHRPVHQAVASAKLAIEDAEFESAGYDAERIAVGVGTSVGSLDDDYSEFRRVYEEQGWDKVSKLASSTTSSHAPTANVAAKFGLRGPAVTIGTGCATGLDVLAWGKRQLQTNSADAAVVGATESPLTDMVFASACAMGILSTRNDMPEKAMRPFSEDADGLVLSEAAVVVVLERASDAKARGARILGQLAGTGSSSEGRNPLVLEKDGKTVGRAIEGALRDAGMQADELDCAHCHGVSVPAYDRAETNGFKRALGAHAYRIPISATKSMVGQPYSTGGLLGVAAALLSLDSGVVPPTLNLETPDPECDLDYVPLRSRINDVNSALVTALSFGGTHGAAVLRKLN